MTDTPSRGDESGVSYSGDDRMLKGHTPRSHTDTAPSAVSAVPTRSPLPWPAGAWRSRPAALQTLGCAPRSGLGVTVRSDGAARQKSPICGATSPRLHLPGYCHTALIELTSYGYL